jgi:CDP-glucose 4,6-dehydratase
MNEILKKYNGKKVLVTGHTGFKGTYLCHMLSILGAEVAGYALPPNTNPSIFEISPSDVKSYIGDVRNLASLMTVFNEFKPEIVFHLAAQPIVLEGYKSPHYTYETNVMGTVNVLECIRQSNSVRSFVNVTTDKVYENKEWIYPYRENERLDGYDPYSNSKSCSELVTASYKRAFLKDIFVSTCRAGNVIGGGDFAPNRIVPDCVRAYESGEKLIIRNPNSTRPFQHVFEPLYMYLVVGISEKEGCYNIGPDLEGCVRTIDIVEMFREFLPIEYEIQADPNAPHEANFLRLDNSLIKSVFDYKPKIDIRNAVRLVAEWQEVGTVKQVQQYLFSD